MRARLRARLRPYDRQLGRLASPVAHELLSEAVDRLGTPRRTHFRVVHIEACVGTRFRSKDISRGGGLADVLAQRQGPVLLAWGEHDVTAEPAVIARVLSERVPDCRTQIIGGAGHWVQYERANDINNLLLAWLDADPQR